MPLVGLVLLFLLGGLRAADLQPTPAPAGPYRVSANRILDRDGQPYLIRGTELATVTLEAEKPGDLGALSASALITIRLRVNMNAVWLPFLATNYGQDAAYRARVGQVVRTANRLELLVILDAQSADTPSSFWTELAADFRDNPNVFFAVHQAASAVAAIRAAHASQPILVDAAAFPQADANIVYQAAASYAATRTDDDRRAQFGTLAGQVPVLVKGLDPHLEEDSPECAAFPADPGVATAAVQQHLAYFDSHEISWIISSFTPGHLITDTRYFNGTKLDDGWICGKGMRIPGLGIVLLSHLWHSDPHGLFVVNGEAGGFLLARGGRAVAYGPILADHEMGAIPGQPPPTRLSNVSVRITDSRGVARLAPLLYTGAGWAFLTFLVPESVTPGLAEIAIVRTDGSQSACHSIIADAAPGFLSASVDGRGAAKGLVTQRLADGSVRTSEASRCSGYDCSTVPIPLAHGVSTTVRLEGTGFRHARAVDVKATVGDVSVPVVSFGAVPESPGRDQFVVKLPDELIGAGEDDLLVKVNGRLSNVVRINCGGVR